MRGTDLIQVALYVAVLWALSPLLGRYLAWALDRDGTNRFERAIARVCGFGAGGMDWRAYAAALLAFSAVGVAVVFCLQLFQARLPLNPAGAAGVPWHSAFNTAVSFVTNTNWQGYAGETTLSYLSQMLALGVQNFVSASAGIAVLLALVRGIRGNATADLGNFWIDATRATTYVLLPAATILTLVLMGEGVVQNFDAPVTVTTLEGGAQRIPMGPAASQVAIKQLGTNGGGFFNANSAHPLENPTPASNFAQMLAILLIPAGLVFAFGRMVGHPRHARTLFGLMLGAWALALAGSFVAEYAANPVQGAGAFMEGKEVRFGVANSLIWATATTMASNGSVNAMISSLSPLAGGIAMFNIMLGEVIFGGVGAGLYGMLLFVLLTVFLVGLMVGRTPEYLGKKIEAREIRMVVVGIVLPCAAILGGTALSCVLGAGRSSASHAGPHGFSEILYAFTSAAGNNGSAFAGLNANTVYYNVALAIAMLLGRFGVIVPVLYVAGKLGAKRAAPVSAGTFDVSGPMFAALLAATIFIVGALTFLPALCLGPIVEHFAMAQGRVF